MPGLLCVSWQSSWQVVTCFSTRKGASPQPPLPIQLHLGWSLPVETGQQSEVWKLERGRVGKDGSGLCSGTVRIHGRGKIGSLKGCESIWVNRCRETEGEGRTGKLITLQNNFQPCLRQSLRLCFEEGMSSTTTASHSLAPIPAGCRCCLVTSARQVVSYRGFLGCSCCSFPIQMGKSWSHRILLGTDTGL